MTIKKTLTSIVLAGALAISACNDRDSTNISTNNSSYNEKPAITAIANQETINVGNSTIVMGEMATIPDWKWVDVVNSNPVTQHYANGSNQLERGETCGVETDGTIEVLGFTQDKRVLVEYTAPGNPMGTPCPSGTQYLLQPEEFIGLTGQYEQKIGATDELKSNLRQILDGKSPIEELYSNGNSIHKGDKAKVPDWEWVNVMNLSPVVQRYRNDSIDLKFSDDGDFETCGVETGGTIEVLGFTQDKRVLVEYTAPGNPMGTPCPSGTQYLISPDTFQKAENISK